MFKNLTITQISFYISFFVWLVQIAVIGMISLFVGIVDFPWIPVVIFVIASLILSFFVIRLLIERYIFRKIKLVYKIIGKSKDSLQDAPELKSGETSLEEINDRAVEWAEAAEEEISTLKSLETYRKKFVGDISHELKTPLFSIQGYLYTLLDGALYDENINRKYLQRAVNNTERLQMIVEDLELINKLEADAQELNMTDFDIKELVMEVYEDLMLQAKEREIDLIFKPGADKAFTVHADREKVRQVFINLISNSIKYGKEKGLTKVSFYDMDEQVFIEVSDNGVGIDEENLKHVFDRFYRADESRSRKIGGSGLGLSIVKHIMEAHKQKLTVRSTLGVGSTFGLTLQRSN